MLKYAEKILFNIKENYDYNELEELFAVDNDKSRFIIQEICNLKDPQGCSALWYAAQDEKWELVNSLIKAGADVDCTCQAGDGKGVSVLWFAAADAQWELVKRLITQGANINSIGEEDGNKGVSVIWWAAFNQNWQLVEFLLEGFKTIKNNVVLTIDLL